MASIKDSAFARFFYELPGAASLYHFLWALGGAWKYGNPSRSLTVIGITGTKGKTTTLELLNAMLEAAHKKTALLSSLRVKIGDETRKNPSGNSMPGRAYIQRFLADAVGAQCDHALIEVTSQGVVQHRHRFIDWSVGAITNLAPEHIEAHGSFENYRAAKLAFLQYAAGRKGKIFLNREDRHFAFFSGALGEKAFSVARDGKALARLMPEAPKFFASEFNLENVALAVAIAKELGVSDAAIKKALREFAGVPGRAEFIIAGDRTAVVDYAHTPDSLEAIYRSVKPRSRGQKAPRLICVLGAAGGGRDRWKRPAMGKIAAEYCDEIILTNEDPYDEDPWEIVKEVERGVSEGGGAKRVRKILDRREAIRTAVGLMKKGDVVVGTGKGSEDWIHVARGRQIPWNERNEFAEALRAKAGGMKKASARAAVKK